MLRESPLAIQLAIGYAVWFRWERDAPVFFDNRGRPDSTGQAGLSWHAEAHVGRVKNVQKQKLPTTMLQAGLALTSRSGWLPN